MLPPFAANNGGQTMYTDANDLTVGTVDISALTLNGVTVAAVSVIGVTTDERRCHVNRPYQ